jgi:hypothetical protein
MWSNTSTSQTITVANSGTFSVTVTDAFGCTGTASIAVTEATELTLNPPDRTICEGSMVTLSVGNFETYQWSNSATTPTITVTQGGTYAVTVTDGGCMGTADIVVTVNQTPFADVLTDASACNDPANGSTINFNTLVVGGDMGGVWADLSNSGATGTFPNLDFAGVPPGVYTFQYTTNSALNPCSDVSYMVDVAIGISPELNIPNALCNNSGQLNLTTLYVAGTPTSGSWSIISAPPGGSPAVINGNTFNASNSDAGVYQLQYTISGFPGNCPDSDVVSITVNPEPDAGFAVAPAQVCIGDDTLLVLNQLISGADSGGTWTETSGSPSTGGAFNATNGTFNSVSQNSGTYTFEYVVNGTAPCPNASSSVQVVIEKLPVADAGPDGALTCDKTSVTLGGVGTSTGPGFTYLWTTVGGVLVNPTSLNATATRAGTYTLTVINTVTGCESKDQIVVTLEGDIPTDLNLNVLSPQCVGDPPGSAQVVSVVGGTPPYVYAFNGAPPSATSNWSNLIAGDYTVVVTDDLGCKYETTFSIGTANDIAGTLAGDAIVELGDPAMFSYDLSIGIADSTVWFVNGTPVCFDCDSTFVFTPTGRSQVEVVIYDDRGCELILSAFVQVKVPGCGATRSPCCGSWRGPAAGVTRRPKSGSWPSSPRWESSRSASSACAAPRAA